MKIHALKHPEITFVLIHFSKRYADKEIKAFFEKEKAEAEPGSLENIILWLEKEEGTGKNDSAAAKGEKEK